MKVEKLEPDAWKYLSEKAHLISFGEHKPAEWDRICFALLALEEKTIAAYVTCREHDAHTLYWQFGGAMPETRGTTRSFRAYTAFVQWSRERYHRVTTLIENTNAPMLKMAAKVGFKIIGVRNYKGSVLLEHLLEFGGN